MEAIPKLTPIRQWLGVVPVSCTVLVFFCVRQQFCQTATPPLRLKPCQGPEWLQLAMSTVHSAPLIEIGR